MTGLLWRWVEKRLARTLPPLQQRTTLGDLMEDHSRRRKSHGRVLAALWLVRECRDVSRAYRTGHYPRSTPRLSMPVLQLPELRVATRGPWRRQLTALAVICSTAVSVGFAGAAALFVERLLVTPVKSRNLHRLQAVGEERASGIQEYLSYSRFQSIAGASQGVFDAVTAFGFEPGPISGTGFNTQGQVGFVSGNFFSVLGTGVRLGRPLLPGDDDPGAAPTVVLASDFWLRAFNGVPDVLGQKLTIGAAEFIVVGVAEDGFSGPRLDVQFEVFVPLSRTRDARLSDANYLGAAGQLESPLSWLSVWGLAASGQNTAVPTATSAATLADGRSIVMTPAEETVLPLGSRARMRAFAYLVATVSVLMVLASAGTNLMWVLLDVGNQQREWSIRVALGAGRPQLLRLVVSTLSLPLVLGGLLSIPVHSASVTALQTVGAGQNLFPKSLGSPDGGSVGAVVGSTIWMLGFLVALVPPLVLSWRAAVRQAPMSHLRDRSHQARLNTLLVVLQTGLAVCLLAVAVSFVRSFHGLTDNGLGYRPELVFRSTLSFDQYGYRGPQTSIAVDQILSRLSNEPGVVATAVSVYAGGVTPNGRLIVDGRAVETSLGSVGYGAVSSSYFGVYGARLVSGRLFGDGDSIGGPAVAVVSKALASRMSGQESVVGRRLYITGIGKEVEIVGVVTDITLNLQNPRPSIVYLSYAQHSNRLSDARTIVVAANGAGVASAAFRSALTGVDPRLAAFKGEAQRDRFDRQVALQRFGGFLIGSLAFVTVCLSGAGVLILASTVVAAKRQELALRAALGATPQHTRLYLLRHLGARVAMGIAVGALGYFTLTPILAASLTTAVSLGAINVLPGATLLVAITTVCASGMTALVARQSLIGLLAD